MAIVLKKEGSLQKKILSVEKEINSLVSDYEKACRENKNKNKVAKILSRKKMFFIALVAIWFFLLFSKINIFPVVAILAVAFISAERNAFDHKSFGLSRQITSLKKELGSWEKGLEGETLVSDKLLTLPNDYYILNDVKIFNHFPKTQIDHVIIGDKGVIVIETKYGKFFKNPQKQAQKNADILSEILKVSVYPLVVFPKASTRYIKRELPVPVIQLNFLIDHILGLPNAPMSFLEIKKLAYLCASIASIRGCGQNA